MSLYRILEIQDLFRSKGWDFEEQSTNYRFEAFCSCLSLLNDEEQKFLIEISTDFQSIGVKYFIKYIEEAYKQIPNSRLAGVNSVFIFPLTSYFRQQKNGKIKTTAGKTKSAEFLFYMLINENISNVFCQENMYFSHSLNNIFKKMDFEKDLIVLIDDFSGTGETAISTCEKLLSIYDPKKPEKKLLEPSNLVIITIAALRGAIENIKAQMNIDLYSSITGDKGISDKYDDPKLMINLMKKIEKKIGFRDDFLEKYSLGYKSSEAMFSFLRPPNNTFPVFWGRTHKFKNPIFPRISKNVI
ncbi:MAG: hypothetical protein J7F05_09655 [Trichodesmium erythraeum GBRTRLIN201]|nr:hypothetical protein [Trichodesmium erythraeum GBRTRLIN201]